MLALFTEFHSGSAMHLLLLGNTRVRASSPPLLLHAHQGPTAPGVALSSHDLEP